MLCRKICHKNHAELSPISLTELSGECVLILCPEDDTRDDRGVKAVFCLKLRSCGNPPVNKRPLSNSSVYNLLPSVVLFVNTRSYHLLSIYLGYSKYSSDYKQK